MIVKTLLACSASSLLLAGAAKAADIGVLMADGSVVVVDTAAKKVTRMMKVTGTTTPLVGIDVRPADGMLYGLTADGTLYTIAMDGKATMKSKLETMLPSGVTATVDFNPVADRLRVIGSDGTSLRANVEDGKVMKDGSLKYADTDANKDKKPKVVAGAYTNSVKGTKETTLYDIDASTGALVKQAPPNDGILVPNSTPLPSTSGRMESRTRRGFLPTGSCGRSTWRPAKPRPQARSTASPRAPGTSPSCPRCDAMTRRAMTLPSGPTPRHRMPNVTEKCAGPRHGFGHGPWN